MIGSVDTTMPASAPAPDPLITWRDGVEHNWDAYWRDARVSIDQNCVVLRPTSGNAEPTLSVWPNGTTWDENTSTIVLPDGETVHEGDVIGVGGGVTPYVQGDVLLAETNLGADGLAKLEACVASHPQLQVWLFDPVEAAAPAAAAPPAAVAEPSTPATTEPPAFDVVIETTDASILGQQLFDSVDVEAFAELVSARLGRAPWDTGWLTTPAEFACTQSQSFRTMWWGDLRLTFETGTDSKDRLTAWSLGDPTVSSLAPLGPLPPSTEPATSVTTGEGIGIGTTLTDLRAALGDRWYDVQDGRVDIPGAVVTTFLLDDDQRVTAIGSGRVDCIDNANGTL